MIIVYGPVALIRIVTFVQIRLRSQAKAYLEYAIRSTSCTGTGFRLGVVIADNHHLSIIMSDGSRSKRCAERNLSSWDQEEALRNEANKKPRRVRVQPESSTVEKAPASVSASSSAAVPPRKVCSGCMTGHVPSLLAFVAKSFKATSRFLDE
eukprot:scaffold7467_cov39-Attheya_sp.AAC.2